MLGDVACHINKPEVSSDAVSDLLSKYCITLCRTQQMIKNFESEPI